jgi:acyl carrier protein
MTGPAQQLCLPSDDAVLVDRIRGFIADALDCAVDDVAADDDVYGKLGMDSLGAVMVFVELSYELGVPEPPPDADLGEMNTARRLAAYARSFETAAISVEPRAGP